MVDVTDGVFRRMARLFTRRAMLYTEMIAAEALCHEKYRLIEHTEGELPCVLQLGGNDPQKLARAAKTGEKFGYSAVNLNAGCPSDKVQSGNFGAVLMKTPALIADCLKAMQDAVSIPVTVKTRIGVDELDSEEFTFSLIKTISDCGCGHIIVHARKCWLNGLSPKENRSVPPLDYARVKKAKALYPDVAFSINGGIVSIGQCREMLSEFDGVMLGRAVIDNPYILASVDSEIFSCPGGVLSRGEILSRLQDLAAELSKEGIAFRHLARHAINLFNGCPGSKHFRRFLSEHMGESGAGPATFETAYKMMKANAGIRELNSEDI